MRWGCGGDKMRLRRPVLRKGFAFPGRASNVVLRLRLRLKRRGAASPKPFGGMGAGPERQSLSARQGGRAAKAAGWRRLLAVGVCDVPKGQACGARSVLWIHAEHGHVSNTASLTTANPQANSPARAGPGYCASLRGTAVPAVITGGTPVPQFMSLCIVQLLSALLFGVDVEGVKTPIPEQSLLFVH